MLRIVSRLLPVNTYRNRIPLIIYHYSAIPSTKAIALSANADFRSI